MAIYSWQTIECHVNLILKIRGHKLCGRRQSAFFPSSNTHISQWQVPLGDNGLQHRISPIHRSATPFTTQSSTEGIHLQNKQECMEGQKKRRKRTIDRPSLANRHRGEPMRQLHLQRIRQNRHQIDTSPYQLLATMHQGFAPKNYDPTMIIHQTAHHQRDGIIMSRNSYFLQ